MSIELMNRVLESNLSPEEKLVMLAIADNTDWDNVYYEQPINIIACRTGISVDKISHIIKSLEENGILTETGTWTYNVDVKKITA